MRPEAWLILIAAGLLAVMLWKVTEPEPVFVTVAVPAPKPPRRKWMAAAPVFVMVR